MASHEASATRRSIAAISRSAAVNVPAEGTTPSQYRVTIAMTREARLPKPFASSAW